MSNTKSIRPTAWVTTVLTAILVFFKLAKLTAIASLPWVWVLAPLWIIPAAWLTLTLVAVLAAFVTIVVAVYREKRKERRRLAQYLKDKQRRSFNSSWFR